MQKEDKIYLIIGLAFTIALFLVMELSHPYSFTKDDNFAQFLPSILEGYKQIFSGDFPSINLHQYAGSRLFEVGTYAFFYPPLFLSYVLAEYFFHNPFYLFEIFIFIHLVLGLVATYYFIKGKTRDRLVSLLGAIAWIFSGYLIIASGNWYYVMPAAVFLPLMFILHDRLLARKSSGQIFLTGIVRATYFYAGNVQYFIFACCFELLYFLFCLYQNKEDVLRKTERYLFSLAITFALVLPLLVPQIHVALESPRGLGNIIDYLFGFSTHPVDFVKGSLFVYPFVKSISSFAYAPASFIHVFYTGTIFFILFFVGGVYSIFRKRRKFLGEISPFFYLGLLAVILSMGPFGGLYSIGSLIPMIKNFSSPVKLMLFANFFIVAYGAIVFASARVRFPKRYGKIILLLITLFFCIVMIYHVQVSSKIAWSYYGDKMPLKIDCYANLNLTDYRVISVFTESKFNPTGIKFSNNEKNFGHAQFISQDFATYYSIDHISGYEPFIDKLTTEKIYIDRFGVREPGLNLTTLKEYGIGYVFIATDSLPYHKELKNFTSVIFSDENMTILGVNGVRPYVFYDGGKISYRRLNEGFDFDTDFDEQTEVTVNLLYKPEFIVEINGKRATVMKDPYGRIYFSVPRGKSNISVMYEPIFFYYGLAVAGVFMAFIPFYLFIREGLLMFILSKRNIWDSVARLFKKYKFIRVVMVLLIVLLILYLVAKSLISPANIGSAVFRSTNVDVRISEIKPKILTANLVLINVSAFDSKKEKMFSAKEIELSIDFIQSFKNSISLKRPVFVFDKFWVRESEISMKKAIETNLSCDKKLTITTKIPPSLNYPVSLKGDIEFENARLLPLNKAYLSIQDEEVKLADTSTKLDFAANLSIEKYVSGSIELGNDLFEEKKVTLCRVLPIEGQNDWFLRTN